MRCKNPFLGSPKREGTVGAHLARKATQAGDQSPAQGRRTQPGETEMARASRRDCANAEVMWKVMGWGSKPQAPRCPFGQIFGGSTAHCAEGQLHAASIQTAEPGSLGRIRSSFCSFRKELRKVSESPVVREFWEPCVPYGSLEVSPSCLRWSTPMTLPIPSSGTWGKGTAPHARAESGQGRPTP